MLSKPWTTRFSPAGATLLIPKTFSSSSPHLTLAALATSVRWNIEASQQGPLPAREVTHEKPLDLSDASLCLSTSGPTFRTPFFTPAGNIARPSGGAPRSRYGEPG